jgi:predicted nucleotidyltransferase
MDRILQYLKMVCNILQKHVPSHEVWAFGSRINGKAKKYSDLDLAIISDQLIALNKVVIQKG